MDYLLVGVGAFFGGILRAYLGNVFNHKNRSFPLGTLYANALGAIIIGLVAALLGAQIIHSSGNALLAGGFCGGLTTFSTFSYESVNLLIKNKLQIAIFYWFITLILSILLAWVSFHGFSLLV